MSRPSPRLPLLVLAALTAVACAAPIRWREIEHDATFEAMWDEFVTIGTRAGYPPAIETDRGRRTFVSKWRSQPAPFRMGRRTRLHGEFERLDEAPGWRLRFWVENQVVKDISVGFDPTEDEWSDGGQDSHRETVLLGQLRLAFGQRLGIQPSFGPGQSSR